MSTSFLKQSPTANTEITSGQSGWRECHLGPKQTRIEGVKCRNDWTAVFLWSGRGLRTILLLVI